MVVCDGWKDTVDPYVNGEVGSFAGSSMASGELCSETVEGWQNGVPAGGGNEGGGRETRGAMLVFPASEAGVRVVSSANGRASFVAAPRPVSATYGGEHRMMHQMAPEGWKRPNGWPAVLAR